jgi:hypothetical protein
MTGSSRPSGRFTTALWALAGLAMIDVISCLARFATDANDRMGWLRLVCGGLATLGFTTWAVRRRRAGPPPEATPAGQLIEPPRPRARRRWLHWVLAPIVLGAGTVTIIDQWGTLSQAVNQLHHLDWRFVRWSIYAEVGSILAFALLWARLLRARETRLSLGSIIAVTLAGNALLVSLPGGLAWSTTFSFNALRRRGVTRAVATRVLVVSTVLSIVALATLALVGLDLAGASGPVAGLGPLITGIAAGVGVLVTGVVLGLRRSGRLAGSRARVAELAGAFPRRTLVSAGLAATSNWVLDCICLIGAILAVGGHVPWQGVLVAYAVGQLAENLPITPGGIGVVEGVLTLMLVAYGMHNSTALAAVLLYRIISFWLLVPLGWATVAAMVLPGRAARVRAPVHSEPAAV